MIQAPVSASYHHGVGSWKLLSAVAKLGAASVGESSDDRGRGGKDGIG
jgi:hypothetical protein